jgi:hypothetical protein
MTKMPSSPGYVRDYKQERKTATARGETKDNAARKRARRIMVKKGLVKPNDGKEVDHIVALDQGGSGTAVSNLRVKSRSDNRSFPRTSTGSMKENT